MEGPEAWLQRFSWLSSASTGLCKGWHAGPCPQDRGGAPCSNPWSVGLPLSLGPYPLAAGVRAPQGSPAVFGIFILFCCFYLMLCSCHQNSLLGFFLISVWSLKREALDFCWSWLDCLSSRNSVSQDTTMLELYVPLWFRALE